MLPVHQRPFFVVLRVVVQVRESGVVAHLATYITAHNPFKLLQAVDILQAGLHTRIMFTDNLAKAELISLLSCHESPQCASLLNELGNPALCKFSGRAIHNNAYQC